MGSVRTSTWPTMGPPRDERGLPKRCFSEDDTLELSTSVNFTCGSSNADSTSQQMTTTTSGTKIFGLFSKYSKSQWMTLVGLAFGNFAIGACVSLQAPFFPKEAEKKGASATEYGVVFGVYQLTFLLGSFFFGKLVGLISPFFMLTTGIFIVGISSILFGVLDRAPSSTFIPLAVSVRVAEGIGSISAKTATYSIIGLQFPDNVATTFASLETCLGVGLIVGPTVGGALYELGGYPTPFMVTGILLLLDALAIFSVLPRTYEVVGRSGKLFLFWSHPTVLLNAVTVFTTFVFIGFQGVALEPHIRQFNLSPVVVGFVFVVCGGTYAVTAPLWGNLIDRGIDDKCLTILGCTILLISEGLIGPASFIHLDRKLWMIVLALFLCGLGCGAKLVSTFISCLRKAISRGFPNDLTTFGLVSTMYSSSLSLGAFTGPTVGGYLFDVWGFPLCCSVLMCIEALMILAVAVRILASRQRGERISLLRKESDVSQFEASYSQIF